MELENVRSVSAADVRIGDADGGDVAAHPDELEVVLSTLQAQGWGVLRDLEGLAGATRTTPFVLVGPAGVVAVDTADRVSWRSRPDDLLVAAGSLAATLPPAHRGRVRSVLVLLGGPHDLVARCRVAATVDTVPVCHLAQWLGADEAPLGGDTVSSLTAVLNSKWSNGRTRLLTTSDVPPTEACIPEASVVPARRRRSRRFRPVRVGRIVTARHARGRNAAVTPLSRPDFTLTDLFRVILAMIAVTAGLYLLSWSDPTAHPVTVGSSVQTPVPSSVANGPSAHSQTPVPPRTIP